MEDCSQTSNQVAAMKIAIVHEWFISYAGAEKVVEQILKLFPAADVFVMVDFLPETDRGFLQGHKVTTSFIQHLPFSKKKYRTYLPLMPLAVEQFDLSAYNLIISSSHAVAKGVITGPNQLHISYVHSPMRYAWDLQHQYLRETGLIKGFKGWVAKYLLHRLRIWDLRTANGVDVFISNSAFIAKRIWKIYRRDAQVIFPPVNVNAFSFRKVKEDYYLAASRLVPYKKMDLIVEAFACMPNKKLIVIGDGPDKAKIESIGRKSANICFMGYQPNAVLQEMMQNAKAYVFAAEEDFGITPVEAQACGTPVIAFGKGGVLETVIEGETGLFFAQQSVESLVDAVMRFEEVCHQIRPEDCRQSAERFSEALFCHRFMSLINSSISS
jgi:glycosyltransferase involved in cell wall biosynthesis